MSAYADMHCDSLLRAFVEGDDSLYNGKGMQSIEKMARTGQLLQFFAIFFPPAKGIEMMAEKAGKEVPDDDAFYDQLRKTLISQVNKHSDEIALALNGSDVRSNRDKGLTSAILTLEDGRFVNGDMDKLSKLYSDGVRAIALTWNGANCFGFPNSRDDKDMKLGLTDFGKEAVLEMNRLGIVVDVSHLSDGGFWDVVDISQKPFIASHSNCRALTDHPRNLTDEMIRAIAEKGGAVGINFGPDFVHLYEGDDSSSVKALAEHMLHLINVGGEDVACIGTDFDGVGGELEIDSPDKMELLFEELRHRGVSERVIDKVTNQNVLRILDTVVGV